MNLPDLSPRLPCSPRALAGALIAAQLLLAACTSPTEVAQQHYENGLALFRKGGREDVIQADREFRNALEIKRTLAPAIYGLALVAERQGKLPEQFSYLNQTLDQDPNHFEARVKVGKMLLGAGQVDKAAEAGDKALSLRPEDPSGRVLRAAVLLRQGKREEAVALAGKVLAQAPGQADALELLANERLAAGDAEAALGYFERGLQAQPGQTGLLLGKVQVLEKLGRLDAAEQALRDLIRRHPENPAFQAGLVRFLVIHERRDAAEAELRAVAAREPGNNAAKLEVVRFVHALKGEAAARRELADLIAREPDNHELKFALAALHQGANERAAAEALLRDILARAGDGPDGLKAKGQLAAFRLGDGDKAGAVRMADEILAKDNRNEQALLLKVSLALEEGQLDRAVSELRGLLRDVPDSPRALVLLGRAHEMQGLAALAEDQFAQAYRVSRMEPVYGLALAEFLLRQGQSGRAEQLLTELLRAKPAFLPALRLLAQARSNLGNWAGVRQARNEIQRLGG